MALCPAAKKRPRAIASEDAPHVRGPQGRLRMASPEPARPPDSLANTVSSRASSTAAAEPPRSDFSWPLLSEKQSILRASEAEASTIARGLLRRASSGRLQCTCGKLYTHDSAACRCVMGHARQDAESLLVAVHSDAMRLGMWLRTGDVCPSCGCADGGWVCSGAASGECSHVLSCHEAVLSEKFTKTPLAVKHCLHTQVTSPKFHRHCVHGCPGELLAVQRHLCAHKQSEAHLIDFLSHQLASARKIKWSAAVVSPFTDLPKVQEVRTLCDDGALGARVHACLAGASRVQAASLATATMLGYFVHPCCRPVHSSQQTFFGHSMDVHTPSVFCLGGCGWVLQELSFSKYPKTSVAQPHRNQRFLQIFFAATIALWMATSHGCNQIGNLQTDMLFLL